MRVEYYGGMADRLRLRFETQEGQPCSRPPVSAAELRFVLSTEGLLELLRREGLPSSRVTQSNRIDLRTLSELADRLDSERPGVTRLRELLREMTPQDGRSIFVVLERPERPATLSLLETPASRSAAEYERDLESGNRARIDEALQAIASWTPVQVEDPDKLSALLSPHLRATRTRGAAARVVGALELRQHETLLEKLLRQGNTLENRLEILGALLRLERDELALRTLRSMLIYGPKENHSRIADLLVRVAQVRHMSALRAMVRLLDPVERVVLSTLLYRLGEMSAYAMISRAVNALTSATSGAITSRILDAIPLVNSTRFTPIIEAYIERETRPWFSARALALLSHLQTHGRVESSCAQLLREIEHTIWTGQAEIGMRLVDQLTTLEPNHAWALYLKASMLKDLDRLEEALKCATRAITTDPSEWQVHRLRGSLQWDLGRSEAALEGYAAALELNPTDPYTWYYKGYVLYRMRKPTHALPCLDRSLSLQPDAPAVLNHKAFCLEHMNQYDEAVACYRRSLKYRPADLATRDHLANALLQASALKEALAVVDMTLKISPRRVRSLEHRAEILRSMKLWQQAEEAFAELVREAPDLFSGWVSRGTINHRMGNLDRAIECLRQAVRLNPESIPARNLLTRFLGQQRDSS